MEDMFVQVALDGDETTNEDLFSFAPVRRKRIKKQVRAECVNAPQKSPSQSNSNQPAVPKNQKGQIHPIIGYNLNVPEILGVLKDKELKINLENTRAWKNFHTSWKVRAERQNKYPFFHRETQLVDILSETMLNILSLKYVLVTNLVTKRDKALHLGNPTLPIKLQSGLFMATFESTQELIKLIKIRYTLHQNVAFGKMKPK